MCNAWNHSIGCTCGWGGDGHLGKAGSRVVKYNPILTVNVRKYSSYINPNAKCPVCNASVFFYKSENGGRVYFDELGPPWPKHPCTDHKNITNKILINFKHKIQNEFQWQIDNWYPIEEVKQSSLHTSYIKLFYSDSDLRKVAYIRNDQLDRNELLSPMFLKKLNEKVYYLSFLDHEGKSMVTNAYKIILDAIKSRLHKYALNEIKTTINLATKPQYETALSIAFKNAVEKNQK